MKKNYTFLDWTGWGVIAVTFILFALALFTKGFTHDLLLEIAVFLVSVKLIISTIQIKASSREVEKKINSILETFSKDKE